MNGDGKPDVVAVTEDAVVWYENPTWAKHDIIRGKTERDNVCIQAHDIDGDGRIDFALGAGWHPPDTAKASTLQWLGRDPRGSGRSTRSGTTSRRCTASGGATCKGNGKKQLVVAPLQGRGTKGPNWGEGQGVQRAGLRRPEGPGEPSLAVGGGGAVAAHDPQPPARRPDGDGRDEIVLAGWEGVFLLRPDRRRQVDADAARHGQPGIDALQGGERGQGGPTRPRAAPYHRDDRALARVSGRRLHDPGALGRAGSGIGPGDRRARCSGATPSGAPTSTATATTSRSSASATRTSGDTRPARARRLRLRPEARQTPRSAFDRHTIDDGGMACEDALAADLDGDGRTEIIAGGRATHNVKIYWNRAQ